MKYIERKLEIINLLNRGGGVCNINTLSKKLFVSRSTLRRDLIALEEEGIITRHHGGISLKPNSISESPVTMRKMENQNKKVIIARLAKDFLQDNTVIFLDSSSTVGYLAPILRGFKNITIITNGLNIASGLNTASGIKCYVCPGILKNKSLSIIGEYTTDFLNNFRANISFLSCKALMKDGIYEGDDLQALTKRRMMKNSDKIILLCDNTKEYASGYFKLADYSSIDMIISNEPFSPEMMKLLSKSDCKVITP